MKISVIGVGYVGLTVGACLSDMGNDVICIDKDKNKIEQLKNGILPIFEYGLEDIIKTNLNNRLYFTSDIESAVKSTEVCFITVDTPQNPDGSADLSNVYDAAEQIGKSLNGYKVIVNKSTVPVGTAEKIKEIIKNNTSYSCDVVSNPEFLKQGCAVEDFMSPDRVIIGSNSEKAINIMREIYAPFFRTANRIIVMDTKSAELAKYASNSFLAAKISFINEIANICEKTGADIEMVRQGMAADNRIGNKFLFAGLGYGGSCFPKDIKALINIGEELGVNVDILKSVDKRNEIQKISFIEKITNRFGDDLEGKCFAIWGLSYKPKTNDMRKAPSITIINELLKRRAKIKVYDPKAIPMAKKIFEDKVDYCESMYDTLGGGDALLLLTEWNEFRKPDFDKIKLLLKTPVILDGRNQYNKKHLQKLGFEIY